MIRPKSKFLYVAGFVCLFQGIFSGCGSVDLFNDTFLNQFFPGVGGSLVTVQAKGPLTIVLENLTTEARHQEYAAMGISYIDAKGISTGVSNRTLLAVPQEDRDPSSATFDPSFREIIVLDCGIQEIWFNATAYRTKIDVKNETVTLGNQESVQITYTTASVVKTLNTEGEYEFFTVEYSSYPAVQVPSAHLKITKHYKCGDVIVVGLLDQRYSNRRIVPQTYEADYVDSNSIPGDFGTTRFIADANNTLIRSEYVYPASYVVIPLVMPNITGVNDAYPAMVEIAAKNATN